MAVLRKRKKKKKLQDTKENRNLRKQKAGNLGLGDAYNSAIDDSSKLHLLPPQAVQVQGQAFKQALVTQL